MLKHDSNGQNAKGHRPMKAQMRKHAGKSKKAHLFTSIIAIVTIANVL